ncbi:NIPSNAP family protein [Leptolyngbya sp. 15MV]|nr:NIPSNAP family protein [Leptolyngbya sp. 15MV]
MIADVRIYTTLPNRLPEFVALYEQKAWPLQLKYLENCLGWYTTIEGELNTVVHIWGYADQADRERRRNAMAADPGWGEYLKEAGARGLLIKMENRMVRPTGFFSAFQAQKKG